MVKLKAPTPQELYRARKQREEQEKIALLPPGLFNHGNTCFMNSVLQGLIATRLLVDLATFGSVPSVVQKHSSTPLLSARSPLLTNGRGIGGPAEQAWVNTMPIGDIFLEVMYRAWDIQLERRRANLSPKSLLGTLGQKYDQYLDFAQQDAHEFLRILLDAMRMEEFDIIKKRQLPLKHVKKRRRTTITPSNLHSAPTDNQDSVSPPLIPEEQKLMSLSDMIFGGKLTSILVCQSCKHVSQTFEDFNDISLSLKAEDYQERKRDRLKNLAKRLTSFPVTFPSSTLVVSPEIPRPSSVPPSPSMRDGTQLVGHEEPPIADDPRRRSLDILATVGQEVGYVPSTTTSAKDTTSLEGDKPSVEANEAVKRKHIGIADPVKEGRKERKDDSWTKIGRRITMSVRLTKGKERASRSKDRHSQDLSQATASLGVPHSLDNTERSSIDGVSSPTSTPRTSMSEMPQGSAPSILLSRPSTPSMQKGPESTSSSRSQSPSRARFSAVRGKSPKPPKATSAETEYLRRILADITPGSSTNPFGLLKPTFHHHNSSNRSVSAGSTASTAQTLWLSMSQFSGIEECLRMFTGVEILDGENMVGCRRCWKIANGALPSGQPSDGQENTDGSSGSSENDSPVAPPPNTWEERNPRQSLPPLSPPMAHIPISISTPTVSLYPYLNNSDSSSISSLHTDVALLASDAEPVEFTPDQSASSLASTEELDSGPKRPTTPGGLPIPVIATTGPDSLDAPSPLRDSASPVTPPEPVDPTSSSSSDKDVTPIAHPTPRLAQVVARLPPSSSGDSLVIPKARHGLHRSDADSADESSGSESESSIARSTDTSTSLEPSHDAAHNKSCSSLPVKKSSRPKPVIMRPAYKRYLIGVPPPVLVIHLKRFQQISKTHMMSFSHGFKKIDDYVTFPEYLDLTPYLAPKKEDFGLGKKGKAKMKGKHREKDDKCMYRLYAVVVHIGNMLGGHYIAYTALPNPKIGTSPASMPAAPDRKLDAAEGSKPERQWAYISDTVVRLTTLEEVLKAKAYICMYERT